MRWSLRRGGEASLCHPVIRCLHLSAHAAPVVDKRALTRRVTPDGSEQLALFRLCFVGRCSPFFSFLFGRRAGLFPSNKA